MDSESYIPFNLPSIGEDEIREVEATLRSGWLTTGPRTAQFEAELCRYAGASHALGVNSCTAGLHLALSALGIGPGSEVITTPLTFCATVNTILQTGATPVLADVGDDGNLDPGAVEASLTERTRAIVPVHLGGLACDMKAIWHLAGRNRLAVIEDAAHAIGSHYDGGRKVGDCAGRWKSDAVAFSFYATKNITTGEGGMVTTPGAGVMERMRVLCLHGISKDAWKRYERNGSWFYQVLECGFKYNLSDVQSAIGIHQLRRLEGFIAERRRQAALYDSLLADIEEIELPPRRPSARHSWHIYAIRLRTGGLETDRGEFIAELQRRGIGTSVHFIPIPLHPAFEAYSTLSAERCPRALALYERLVSLPIYPGLRDGQIERVAREIRAIAARGLLRNRLCTTARS